MTERQRNPRELNLEFPKIRKILIISPVQQFAIREQYSRVEYPGHDYLDIGSGNFTQTNYPDFM